MTHGAEPKPALDLGGPLGQPVLLLVGAPGTHAAIPGGTTSSRTACRAASLIGCSRRFTDEPVAEIVQCGEPISKIDTSSDAATVCEF
jgi:hypothetical protein